MTPADVQTLRDGAPRFLTNAPTSHRAALVYLGGRYALCYQGRIVAWGEPSPFLLLECLRQEAAEPGFIPRILDTGQPCDMAALDPEAFHAAKRQRDADAARARQIIAEAEEARRRRASQIDPARIELDDL